MSKIAAYRKSIAAIVGGVLVIVNNKYGLGIDTTESTQDITNIAITVITALSVFQLRNDPT